MEDVNDAVLHQDFENCGMLEMLDKIFQPVLPTLEHPLVARYFVFNIGSEIINSLGF
jgi:hypothetical protein